MAGYCLQISSTGQRRLSATAGVSVQQVVSHCYCSARLLLSWLRVLERTCPKWRYRSSLCILSAPVCNVKNDATRDNQQLPARPVDHNLFYGMDPTQNFRTKDGQSQHSAPKNLPSQMPGQDRRRYWAGRTHWVSLAVSPCGHRNAGPVSSSKVQSSGQGTSLSILFWEVRVWWARLDTKKPNWQASAMDNTGSGIEIKKEDGVYRTPLLKNRIPEPEVPEPSEQSTGGSGALAAAHWDGRLVCRLAIDIGHALASLERGQCMLRVLYVLFGEERLVLCPW